MATLSRLERCLLPPPVTVRWNGGDLTVEQCSLAQKVVHYVKSAVAFTVFLAVSPLTLAYDWCSCKKVTPIRREPDATRPQPVWPPVQRGFACSLFQTSGVGTRWAAAPEMRGRSDWDRWMNTPGHVVHPDGFDYRNFFTDILSNPRPYIEMLKAQNVTAHRFSLEWSVIEPRRGEIDMAAVRVYQNFIEQLIEAEITPSVTLSHFTVPQWFYEQRNFQWMENIDTYVQFALRAMELFPHVKDWWSFNELGIKAFQQAREVYPIDLPKGSCLSKRVYAAGIATRNMLIAHCKLHVQVAKLHRDKKLGVTHQWLKFDMASGNCLERLVRYFFEKFGFYSVYDFFKEGRYAFEFPFMANIHFEIPREEFEANGRFLMRLGVQAYPKAMLKLGLTCGRKYPYMPGGCRNRVFTCGSSCEPGGTVTRFGPRWKAERIDEILDDAFALTDEVIFTEFGSDARIYRWGTAGFEFNDDAQADYLRQLTERIKSYSAQHKREIKGIFCWSDLRRQLEWELGNECRIGIVTPIVDENRRMTGWRPTPASQYLAEVYGSPHRSKTAGKEEKRAAAERGGERKGAVSVSVV